MDETGIPVVRVELYDAAINDVGIWDVNFLNGQSEHGENSAWMVIRNFVFVLIRATLYIACAILITMLVWHGINVVKGSLTPAQAVEHRNGIQRLVNSVIMLFGTIVIMGLAIFGSNVIFRDVTVTGQTELPIRVQVKSAGFSFNTNVTGYVRFMAGISEVDAALEKAMYTLIYIVLVIANLFVSLLMIGRMLAMMILGIVGPILATLYALNVQVNLRYRNWVMWFVGLALIQTFFAIIYKLLLAII